MILMKYIGKIELYTAGCLQSVDPVEKKPNDRCLKKRHNKEKMSLKTKRIYFFIIITSTPTKN